ncbi:S8 family serine peptidase, partial [Deinococcus pimensis]|uniref:S8 family serine peptidase n=1 Tax=Deinococcus pimensis TaxID=309888 RepID=UPI0012F91EA2
MKRRLVLLSLLPLLLALPGRTVFDTSTTTRVQATQGWNDGMTPWEGEGQTAWTARASRQLAQIRLAPSSGPRGEGVTVAVIDTGVDVDHPALRGSLDLAGAWDLVDRDPVPDDEPGGTFGGHGTAVAGAVLSVAPGAT